MSVDPGAPPDPGLIAGLAAQIYGITLDEARAARISGDLAGLGTALRAAGPVPVGAAPGADFRELLSAHGIASVRHA